MKIKAINSLVLWLVGFAALLLLITTLIESDYVTLKVLIGCLFLLSSAVCAMIFGRRLPAVTMSCVAGVFLALGGHLVDAFNTKGTIVALTLMLLPLAVRFFTGKTIYLDD